MDRNSEERTAVVLWITMSDPESTLVSELLQSSPSASNGPGLDAVSEFESESHRTAIGNSLSSRLPGPRSCGPAAAFITLGIPNLLRIV